MVKTLLDKNIELLSINTGHWIGEPKEKDIQHTSMNDQVLVLGSEFDESNKPNPNKRELIICVGINSIEEIETVIRTMSKESYLIIVEPNFSFFHLALNNQDLQLFNDSRVVLFADELNKFAFFLGNLLSSVFVYYMKSIKFYFTTYYREHGLNVSLELVKKAKETVKYKALLLGNSIEDSLLGFNQTMSNISCLLRSKDVSHLKNTFANKPAIIVSAGPSLNKNIAKLKDMKNKAIVIAVDTIASRLCNEGIIPDFICSVEREVETYTYFYENKQYPSETTLVGPMVLYPPIFEEFKGDIILPMREHVGEFNWIRKVFDIHGENYIETGNSCAHVAFGFAKHIGASPIVLVGQDLAFGSTTEQSHAGGTIYDNKVFTNQVFSEVEKSIVEGYYGDKVTTTDIWINFRLWFEKQIFDNKLFVINATEGGAKIANTIQMSLEEVLKNYCSEQIQPVKDVLKNKPSYPLSEEQMITVIHEQIKYFTEVKFKFENQKIEVSKMKIVVSPSDKEMQKMLKKLKKTDPLYGIITENWLLRHTLQPALLTTFWNLFDIENVLTSENFRRNKEIQVEFLTVSVFVISKIISILEESLNRFK
ncbi:6-hydroxymethylpterin diphosphokinase MptE-like protein [Paenibacillus sp. FSL K6-3182]|uniref:motility associated factor glycosyltransferase family protein n=1 Tax=Paenibacillus sp. FSL K6-3182 TaxID=2921495 RepID=UPI0030CE74E9